MRTFKFWSPDKVSGEVVGHGVEHDNGNVVVTVYGAGTSTYTSGHDDMFDVYTKLQAWPVPAEIVWDDEDE